MNKNIDWITKDKQITEKEIALVEKILNIKFPTDYIECIKLHNGGHPIPEVFDFDKHKEAVFERLLSLSEEKRTYIIEVYNTMSKINVMNIYPFAYDPFGNYICFDYRKGSDKSPHVVFWDHEEADKSPENAIHYVCDTFTDLLNKLYLPD